MCAPITHLEYNGGRVPEGAEDSVAEEAARRDPSL